MKLTRPAAAAALAAALTVAGGADASAATIKGTVVHLNARAHSFVVASRNGALTAVHAQHAPRLGAQVVAQARRLRNGTFAARRVRAAGFRHRTRIRGTVSYVNAAAGEFTVSSRGTSILVHRSHAGNLAAAAATVPPVGSEVEVDVSLDGQDDVQSEDVQQVGQTTTGIELEGTVLSSDVASETITVSADDADQAGAGIVVHVPDASQFNAGDEVELVVDGPAADGSYTLSQSSLDANAHQADRRSGRGDEGGHGDGQQGGDGSQSGGQQGQQPSGADSGSGSQPGAQQPSDS